MKRQYLIEVKGKEKHWSFNFYADDKYVEEWRKDGLEVNELINSIPLWAHRLGLTKVWFLVQDVFNFRFIKKG